MQRRAALVLAGLGILHGCSPSPATEPIPEATTQAAPGPRQPAPPALATPPTAPAPEEEPVVADAEVVEETFDDTAHGTESAFDKKPWNSVIGLGGGAGGKSGGRAGRHRPPPGSETYAHIAEHGYLRALEHPLSTFAIDVDGASWSNVRRFLRDGRLPPPDAVRTEECVNWFGYDDPPPPPGAEHPIAVHAETGPCPWAPRHRLLRVVLRTADVDIDRLPPCNLVFLVDVSGSMQPANKLPLLQRGLRLLVRQMREQDHIGIVTYAGSARVALEPTPGSGRAKIEAAIEGLTAGGSTNGAGGIQAAYRLAHAHKGAESIDRVVLATDGDFNVGVTDRAQLVELVEREREGGVFLSVLGFGTGNLKDATLEALGRHGNGHYAYIDSLAEARRVLVAQSGATLVTVAKDVKVQIEFNPRFVQSYRQIGYENRELAARDFNDDHKDAGEMGAGHVVTALYELVPPGAASPVVAVDELRYQDTAVTAAPAALADDAAARHELVTVKVRYKHPEAAVSRRFEVFVRNEPAAAPGDDFRFASAVAAFALALRGSEHAGDIGIEAIASLARQARGSDPRGERAEFLELVQTAADLVATQPGAR